jgi:DNA-binding beta-propeller fold protein YncE
MRRQNTAIAVAIVCVCALGETASGPAWAAGAPHYAITKSVSLGSPETWDFLFYDKSSHRVYATHGAEITVVDGCSGEIVGRVSGLDGTNGVAVIPEIGKGYTASRGEKAALVFDPATFKVIKEIPAEEDSDAVIFDVFSKHVFIMNGNPHNVSVIDTASDTLIGEIALPGQPEFAVVDGAGKLYINITDKKEIARVDVKSAKVDATWSLGDCEQARGLSLDTQTHRLFASCNEKVVVVDSDNGHVVTTLPIGQGSDGTAFDAERKLVFSSNRDGTLSVIREDGPDKFASLGNVPTQLLARTMALDPETGRIYLVTGDRIETNPDATFDPRQRYSIKRGSVRMLFVDPQPGGSRTEAAAQCRRF